MVFGIINGINGVFNLFLFIIILRIFLTWIPNIDWDKEPFYTIRRVTDFYLDIFRRFIPPFGGLDFSPVIAIIVLGVVQQLLVIVVSMLMKV